MNRIRPRDRRNLFFHGGWWWVDKERPGREYFFENPKTGRPMGLKIPSGATRVWVRFPPPARLISLECQRVTMSPDPLIVFRPKP
jgi:hypothetical protein